MKIICILSILLTSLLMLGYPVILIPNVMGFAAIMSNETPKVYDSFFDYLLSFEAFLWTSTLYPIPWLIGLIFSVVFLLNGEVRWALFSQGAVLAYIAVMVWQFFVLGGAS